MRSDYFQKHADMIQDRVFSGLLEYAQVRDMFFTQMGAREREAASMQAEREGRPDGTRDYDRAQFLLPTAADVDWERTEVVLMHF